MDDATVRAKLIECFSSVFPNLDPSEITAATVESTSGWDSIAHVTLLTLIGEEFGISVNFERFEDAVSFSAIAALVNKSLFIG